MYAHIRLVKDGIGEISYVLEAGVNLTDPSYKKYLPSLSFWNDHGHTYEKQIEAWDNDHYIYETFYKKVLLPWIKDKTIEDPIAFAEFVSIPGIKLEDFDQLKLLIEKGIELGFFEDVINFKKDEKDNNS
jgi:hypothetical protein